MIYIVNALLVIIAGIFVSLASLSEEGKLPYGWNKEDTWMNKYSKCSLVNFRLYGNDRELLKPKFFGSTTFLVFLVDKFHFFQWVYLTLIQISLSLTLFNGWWILIGFSCIKLAMSLIMQLTRIFFTKKVNG